MSLGKNTVHKSGNIFLLLNVNRPVQVWLTEALAFCALTERQGVFMFSYFSQAKAKGNKLLFTALVLVLLFLAGSLFISCSGSSDDDSGIYTDAPIPANLKGAWLSTFSEEFEITSGNEFIAGFGGEVGYKGDIVRHRMNSLGYGYITIKYTLNDWVDSAVGNYYVIYYENLTASTVSLAGAFDGVGKSTQAAAEAEYTVGNGQFDNLSDCTKQ